MAADSVSSSEKGKLLYQSPENGGSFKLVALIFHIIIFTIGIILNILIIAVILAIVIAIAFIAITLNFTGGGVELFEIFSPGGGGNRGSFSWFRFRYLHQRVRVYEKGITRPYPWIKALFDTESEGEFIPVTGIKAYEYSKKRNRCDIYLWRWSGNTGPETSREIYFDQREAVLSTIRKFLEDWGVREIQEYCPKCNKKCGFGSRTCIHCKFDRFSRPPNQPEQNLDELKVLLGPRGKLSR